MKIRVDFVTKTLLIHENILSKINRSSSQVHILNGNYSPVSH